MPARAQLTRNSTAQKGAASAATRRRTLALARGVQAALRNVKVVNADRIKGAVGLHVADALLAVRGAPARVRKRARAAAPAPSQHAAVGTRVRACKDKRRRMDIQGTATDDGEDSDASLGRAVEEGEDVEEALSEGAGEDVEALSCAEDDAPKRRPYKLKALITDLHVLEPLRKCRYGCGAMVWPAEGKLCCSGGTHILGPAFNPPIDDEYWEFLKLPHVSADSRLLNGALAMGSQGVFPSRAMGGLGFHDQRCGHVAHV